MTDYENVAHRADQLMIRRGIHGNVAADRFASDFSAYLVFYDIMRVGSATRTLDLLEDDNNLTDNSILFTNFRMNIRDLVDSKFFDDELFQHLFPVLLRSNGKGVGIGELVLPLLISDYRFSLVSDGVFGDDYKVEIKKSGASLKPVRTGLTEKGLVDTLNKKYWNGYAPGMKQQRLFQKHIENVNNPKDYAKYFEELYVGCDIDQLSWEVERCYTDSKKFCDAVGRFALREYQKTDGWNNIIFIDDVKHDIVNVCDTNDTTHLKLKFSPVMKRGRDSQAIADGFVNVKI